MESTAIGTIRKRRVFYIPGYDPHPPRRYRELYRREATKQGKISGYETALRGRKGGTGYGWLVETRVDGARVSSEFDVLVWSDLVRDSMDNGIPATYWQLLQTVWTYLSTGALRRLMWLRKGPVLAAFYPVLMLLAQAMLALLLGGGLGLLVGRFVHPWAGWLIALPVMVAVLRWFRSHDARFYAYYLMHDYGFTARGKGSYPPRLEKRLQEFRHAIERALDSDVDEVLVVGHSSGAHLAVSVLADLLRLNPPATDRPALALLTLGQVIPMVSFLPRAERLRADLHFLSGSDALCWVDVSAPGDGCSFALCDPVAVSGVGAPDKRWPLVLSAAFSQTMDPRRWKALRRKYFKLHFQYICAFERPGFYDYFLITGGPVSLAGRFAGKAPSKSRIDVPASGHRTMLA